MTFNSSRSCSAADEVSGSIDGTGLALGVWCGAGLRCNDDIIEVLLHFETPFAFLRHGGGLSISRCDPRSSAFIPRASLSCPCVSRRYLVRGDSPRTEPGCAWCCIAMRVS